MNTVTHAKMPVLRALLLSALVASPASAQTAAYNNDISGHWATLFHEDNPERGTGPSLGEYQGLPINDDARAHGMTWDASIQGLPEWRCRPHNPDYAMRSPQHAQIWAVWDNVSREVKSWRIALERTASDRIIYMDGRPHPGPNAPHTWSGFSTGQWIGDILKVTTTHLKVGYIRRNGLPASDQRTFTEYLMRRDNGYLSWVTIIYDPVYMTEPLIRSSEYLWDPYTRVDAAPCVESEEEIRAGSNYGFVPHFLPGANPYIDEFAIEMGLPVEATRGGAETMHPDYRLKMATMKKPAAAATR
jgi:hypothetical protein